MFCLSERPLHPSNETLIYFNWFDIPTVKICFQLCIIYDLKLIDWVPLEKRFPNKALYDMCQCGK